MLKPSPNPNPPLHTIDGTRYIQECCPNYNSLHIVEDSDDIFQIELTPTNWKPIDKPIYSDNLDSKVNETIKWKRHQTNRGWLSNHHQRFTTHNIRVHADPVIEEEWYDAEKQAKEFIRRVLRG
jgi:hypothetical protein